MTETMTDKRMVTAVSPPVKLVTLDCGCTVLELDTAQPDPNVVYACRGCAARALGLVVVEKETGPEGGKVDSGPVGVRKIASRQPLLP